MAVTIEAISTDDLAEYTSIPMWLAVREILAVELIDAGLGGVRFSKTAVQPYVKDYSVDAIPQRWCDEFDTSNWGFFIARNEGASVGAMTLAYRTHGVQMLAGREDLCVLWDIRVHPGDQRSGVGSALMQHAVRWASERGCTQLKIETQNVNVPACEFYVKHGARLGGIDRYAYGNDETMLLWYIDL